MLNQPCYHAFRFIFKLLLMHIPAIVQQANGGPTKSMGRDEVFARIVANIGEIMMSSSSIHRLSPRASILFLCCTERPSVINPMRTP